MVKERPERISKRRPTVNSLQHRVDEHEERLDGLDEDFIVLQASFSKLNRHLQEAIKLLRSNACSEAADKLEK
jgi:hypothetical protein